MKAYITHDKVGWFLWRGKKPAFGIPASPEEWNNLSLESTQIFELIPSVLSDRPSFSVRCTAHHEEMPGIFLSNVPNLPRGEQGICEVVDPFGDPIFVEVHLAQDCEVLAVQKAKVAPGTPSDS